MPGPNTLTYCRALAEAPHISLAAELSQPVVAVLDQLYDVANSCEAVLHSKDERVVPFHSSSKHILEQLDFALALILRNHLHFIKRRAEFTQCRDLLCEVLCGMAMGDGGKAADMVRRWQRDFPEDGRREDGSMEPGSFPDSFAWDVYQRVEELDKLADEFPEHIQPSARSMHGWPMLVHRHTNNRRRFQQLAKRLQLGTEYPTDASEGARFRPDTPMVQYLDPLIYRLHNMRWQVRDRQFDSVKAEQDWLHQIWWTWPEEPPGEEVLAPLRTARQLPPLAKTTALQWAEKALVPLILVTDARDWTKCTEPVLQKIARQKGVKSKATFKSRLLSAVLATLRRLARPA